MTRTQLQTPDHRNNGAYQFVTGWTGGGAEMCVHLTAADIAERVCKKLGFGRLVDDGVHLWWEQDYEGWEADFDAIERADEAQIVPSGRSSAENWRGAQ